MNKEFRDFIKEFRSIRERVRRLELRPSASTGGSSAVDLVWSSLEWNDTSKIDGSGPRQEVKYALLDDLLILSGIAFIDSSYDEDELHVKVPLDLTPWFDGSHTIQEGFAVTYQVHTGSPADLRTGYCQLHQRTSGFPVVYDTSGLYLRLQCNGGTPSGGANVYISGSIRLSAA